MNTTKPINSDEDLIRWAERLAPTNNPKPYLPRATDADIARYVDRWHQAKAERERRVQTARERSRFQREFNRVSMPEGIKVEVPLCKAGGRT
jgi:hypothetical protein